MSTDSTRASSDEVYPLHLQDGWKANHIFISWIMRFNDVLDTTKLHDSLWELLELGDWRKLGGTLKTNKEGNLEIHVPRQFTAERPPFAFTMDCFEQMSIRDHELARQLPTAREVPYSQVISGNVDFRPLATGKDAPKTIEELITRGAPQLSLHITSFSDANLLSLTWPHTLMDGMGQHALLQGWSLVMAGRRDQVPQVLGAREDVLNQVEIEHESDHGIDVERWRVAGLKLVRFILHGLWHWWRNAPKTTKVVYLPRQAFDELKRTVIKESQQEEESSFISEGDILAAWIAKTIASAETKAHPATIVQLVNARGRLHSLAAGSASGGVYMQNMVALAFTALTEKLIGSSTGRIALENRRQLLEQTRDEHMSAFFRTVRKDLRASKYPLLAVDKADSRPLFLNNLTKTSLMLTPDFGPAVLRQGESDDVRDNPLGTMAGMLHLRLKGHYTLVDNFYVLGKDHGENYWLIGTVPDRAWDKFDAELRRLSMAREVAKE